MTAIAVYLLVEVGRLRLAVQPGLDIAVDCLAVTALSAPLNVVHHVVRPVRLLGRLVLRGEEVPLEINVVRGV